MLSRVLGPGLVTFPGARCHHWRLQAVTSRWFIAFALEGLPLDRCVTLNCAIRPATFHRRRRRKYCSAPADAKRAKPITS